MRGLVLLLLGAVVWWLSRLARRSSSELTQHPTHRAPQPHQPHQAGTQPLVACTHCGVQQPRDEALFDADGQPYCGPEHRDAARRAALKR
jgi:Na+-transporting methylmalonyl-CoA/oxaloacetate decarboxylase gamma subunit